MNDPDVHQRPVIDDGDSAKAGRQRKAEDESGIEMPTNAISFGANFFVPCQPIMTS